MNPDHLKYKKEAQKEARNSIAVDKIAWAESKKTKIDQDLQVIQPRAVTTTGHISMHEHLQNIRQALIDDPEGQADAEINRRDQRIAKIEQDMEPTILWP